MNCQRFKISYFEEKKNNKYMTYGKVTMYMSLLSVSLYNDLPSLARTWYTFLLNIKINFRDKNLAWPLSPVRCPNCSVTNKLFCHYFCFISFIEHMSIRFKADKNWGERKKLCVCMFRHDHVLLVSGNIFSELRYSSNIP